MAKIDKTQYSKEEWKVIKAQRKAEKERSRLQKVYNITDTTDQIYILCLKHGTKYSSDYVNRLYNMTKRHCTLPFKFACLTDDSVGIDPNVITLPLPKNLKGWWCKPYIYSKELPINGTILYLDLDVVIADNINHLFSYYPDDWCVVRDFTRVMRPKWEKYNSSVVRFKKGQLSFVWERYIRDQKAIERRCFGDQDWLYEAAKGTAKLFPDNWIKSWKWEVRKSREWAPGGVKGTRKFKYKEDVVPPKECCICVFHGDPNPHRCDDKWVVDNWK